MSTQPHNPGQESGPVPTPAGSKCDGEACRTGICSPCLMVWGLVALWFVINTLLGAFP